MEQVVSKYLKELKIPVSKPFCEKLILSHPDYPSLLSISDTLQRFGINHQAARMSKDQLLNVDVPCLVRFKDGEGLSLVKNKQELSEHLRKYNGENSLADHPSAIEQAVVLMAQPTDTIPDPENREHLMNESFQKTLSVMLLAAIAGLVLLAVVMWFSWWYVALIVTALAGTVVGYLLIGKEIGVTYSPVESFCRAGKRSNCDAVLQSDAAKLFGKFSFSDAVVGYFLFQILVLGILIPFTRVAESFLLALALVSIFALPVVVYSLYYQSIRAKAWCRLCLIVDGVLPVQAGLFGYMFYSGLISLSLIELFPVAASLLLFILVITSVRLLKDTLKKANESERNEIQALRVKSSPEVFTNLLFREKKVDTTLFERELLIGYPNAPITITMAASLGCGPCRDGFEKAIRLVRIYPDKTRLNVRFHFFRISEKNPHPPKENMYPLIYWYHHISGKCDEEALTEKFLKDWYTLMDIKKFQKYYPIENKSINDQIVGDLADQHTLWMEQMSINVTPTFFVNGYKLPSQYRVEDLRFFIVGLSEQIHFNGKKMRKEKTEQKH